MRWWGGAGGSELKGGSLQISDKGHLSYSATSYHEQSGNPEPNLGKGQE